jgi:hypothetical protein
MKSMESAVTVTTYKQFHEFVSAFGRGRIPLLMIIGDPGVSKSQSVRRAVKGEVCWIEGQASAFIMYCELYRHRHKPVVIDDVDALYADDSARRLLKGLCQTDIEKSLAWRTRNKYLEQEGVPSTFTTRSKVCIIANEWRSLNTDVKAIEDRAVAVIFKPTPLEVHLEVARWFKDQVVFDFLGSVLHLIHMPSMRHYLFAKSLRAAGMKNWKELTIERICDAELVTIAQLKADPTLETEKDRVRAWIDRGHGSRPTYFRYARKLPTPIDVPKVNLRVSKSHKICIIPFKKDNNAIAPLDVGSKRRTGSLRRTKRRHRA